MKLSLESGVQIDMGQLSGLYFIMKVFNTDRFKKCDMFTLFQQFINEGRPTFNSHMTILDYITTSWSLQTIQKVLDKRLIVQYPPTSSYPYLSHL
jgi:hypothetical protein